MANALFSLTRLFVRLRSLLADLARAGGPAPAGSTAPQQRVAVPQPLHRSMKPLRVVRVVEPTAPRSTAGRMVISGRLADVCAELDRLAALEAQGC